MDLVHEIENKLASKFKRAHSVLTGSGTTAIYLLLKALELKSGDAVLMPGICCFAPAYAVKYAGLNLDFCDISQKDGCLTPKLLELALRNNNRIKVVIGVHLYGNVLELDDIIKICKERGIVFVEDACQAYGSYYKDEPCGSFGDFSVISFGHTKILDAGGGGALLTENTEIANSIRKMLKTKKKYDSTLASSLSKKHREEYYAIQRAAMNDPQKRFLFGTIWKRYKDLFIHNINHNVITKLNFLLENEGKIIGHRIKLSRLYKKLLNNCSKVAFVESDYRTIPWRFNCLIYDINVEALCDSIRKNGFDISTWYPNLANIYIQDNDRKLKNADIFEKLIVNMWVDETKDESYVEQLCAIVKKNLSDQKVS